MRTRNEPFTLDKTGFFCQRACYKLSISVLQNITDKDPYFHLYFFLRVSMDTNVKAERNELTKRGKTIALENLIPSDLRTIERRFVKAANSKWTPPRTGHSLRAEKRKRSCQAVVTEGVTVDSTLLRVVSSRGYFAGTGMHRVVARETKMMSFARGPAAEIAPLI